MIPLAEINDNKEHDKPLWIAEYMIYCDMRSLEVSLGNPNDYFILVEDYENGKINLTNSLAEFIGGFLKGGVFEIGGLYAWAAEIKARLYGNTDPDNIKPLLCIYRESLKCGLMTKQNVVAEADRIIGTEDEPRHFFIEMSLSRSVNELTTVLDSINLPENALQIRAFFGTISTKLLIDRITSDRAVSILKSFSRNELLTTRERDKMRDLIVESDYLDDAMLRSKRKQRLREKVKDFFEGYSHFNLYHLKNWDKINKELVKKFEST